MQTQLETRMFLSWFRQVVLSYIHVDGDFNPRRVTVVRVHGGLHPRRVHEKATLSIPPWPSPTKDLPHQQQIFTKQAISLPLQTPWFNSTIFVGGSQVTPSKSRRHHSPRSNKWCVDDALLALVLQMIVSPTLNSLSQDLDFVERRFEWKATWEGQRSRFIWQEWNILVSTHEQVALSQKMDSESVGTF